MEKKENKQETKEMKLLSLKEKVLKISSELRIDKDGKNEYSNYKYFTPDGILSAINPLLIKYNVFLHFNLEKNTDTYIGKLELSDIESAEVLNYSLESPEISIKTANAVQSVGGLQTYIKRYLILNAFNIADNSLDFDSNEQHKGKENIQPKPKPETKDFKEQINNCKTIDELSTLYQNSSVREQKEFVKLFSERKAVLKNGK